MRRLFPALLGLAAACTDRPIGEDSETGATTSTTSTATTTTEVPTSGSGEPDTTTEAAEPCLEHSYSDPDPDAWMLTCGLPELCAGDEPLVFITSSDDILDPGEVQVDDLQRARCMAAALRDRSPGQIAWWHVADVVVRLSPVSLEIAGDRALAHSVADNVHGSQPNVHEAVYPLRPPEFFAACAEGDALAVWLCLMDSVEPTCLPGPLACPE
ncbi:hypothetical protein [Nannocystis pusilla]|uniref:Uncharacterized protein n=1 Tax=Nannocystis pusilla TaxID=889268 RepID=A0ABS7TWY6_9BACT|nr:hypothetical protein [Nannocystis pusilla]MBZ5712777.1 hypothetical protein [Nannocystis pusilla]